LQTQGPNIRNLFSQRTRLKQRLLTQARKEIEGDVFVRHLDLIACLM
jgi:hypothetical protein